MAVMGNSKSGFRKFPHKNLFNKKRHCCFGLPALACRQGKTGGLAATPLGKNIIRAR